MWKRASIGGEVVFLGPFAHMAPIAAPWVFLPIFGPFEPICPRFRFSWHGLMAERAFYALMASISAGMPMIFITRVML